MTRGVVGFSVGGVTVFCCFAEWLDGWCPISKISPCDPSRPYDDGNRCCCCHRRHHHHHRHRRPPQQQQQQQHQPTFNDYNTQIPLRVAAALADGRPRAVLPAGEDALRKDPLHGPRDAGPGAARASADGGGDLVFVDFVVFFVVVVVVGSGGGRGGRRSGSWRQH